jgi:hypothetical protein
MLHTLPLLLVLALQGAPPRPATVVGAAEVAPSPLPALVAPWQYPRITRSRFVQTSILPREVNVLNMRTADSAEQVESYYRSRAAAAGGPVAIVSSVGQRIVSHAGTIVSIEAARGYTSIVVIATEPDPEPADKAADPSRPAQPPLTPKSALRRPIS